jgi:putative endonuclease
MRIPIPRPNIRTPSPGECWVYIIQCVDGALYTGVTSNLKRRADDHTNGGSRFTKAHDGKQIVYSEWFPTREAAMARERQIKGLSSDN